MNVLTKSAPALPAARELKALRTTTNAQAQSHHRCGRCSRCSRCSRCCRRR